MKVMSHISDDSRDLLRDLLRAMCVVFAISICYVAVVDEAWVLVTKATPQGLQRAATMSLWIAVLVVCLLLAQSLVPILKRKRKPRNR